MLSAVVDTSAMSQSESCANVWDWLRLLHLEQYSEAFQSSGLATLQQCRSLTPDQLELMGIILPGHQRRILTSLSKTHGNQDTQSDTTSQSMQSEKNLRSEEISHTQMLQRERHASLPMEEKPVPRRRDRETPRSMPRERERPVPKERQASRMKEENEKEGEQKLRRQTGKEDETDGGVDGERAKPVPKERTKFRPSAPVDCAPRLLVSVPSETTLPPIPPRNSSNCPPQRFTSAMIPSPPTQTPDFPKLDRQVDKPPAVQSRSVTQGSTPTTAHTPTYARPQTLAIKPHALGSDGERKTSPVTAAILGDTRNAPPLPKKVAGGTKGPPPIPQRSPAQSPSTHR